MGRYASQDSEDAYDPCVHDLVLLPLDLRLNYLENHHCYCLQHVKY